MYKVEVNAEKCDHQRKETEVYLASLQEEFRAKGINVQTRIGHGLVVKAIIDAAERENADLVAMASHGRTGLSRILYELLGRYIRRFFYSSLCSRTCYGTIQMAASVMLFNT